MLSIACLYHFRLDRRIFLPGPLAVRPSIGQDAQMMNGFDQFWAYLVQSFYYGCVQERVAPGEHKFFPNRIEIVEVELRDDCKEVASSMVGWANGNHPDHEAWIERMLAKDSPRE